MYEHEDPFRTCGKCVVTQHSSRAGGVHLLLLLLLILLLLLLEHEASSPLRLVYVCQSTFTIQSKRARFLKESHRENKRRRQGGPGLAWGSQATTTVSSPARNPVMMRLRLSERFPWVIMTPLGSLVEPGDGIEARKHKGTTLRDLFVGHRVLRKKNDNRKWSAARDDAVLRMHAVAGNQQPSVLLLIVPAVETFTTCVARKRRSLQPTATHLYHRCTTGSSSNSISSCSRNFRAFFTEHSSGTSAWAHS